MQTTNLVIMLGYVANDPVEKEFPNNKKSVQFSLKTRDFYGNIGERKVDKNFHNIIMWNSICHNAVELLHKGDVVHIIGRLKNKKVERRDGTKVTYTEIVTTEWSKISDGDGYEDVDREEVKLDPDFIKSITHFEEKLEE